jgi:hypothetical protein
MSQRRCSGLSRAISHPLRHRSRPTNSGRRAPHVRKAEIGKAHSFRQVDLGDHSATGMAPPGCVPPGCGAAAIIATQEAPSRLPTNSVATEASPFVAFTRRAASPHAFHRSLPRALGKSTSTAPNCNVNNVSAGAAVAGNRRVVFIMSPQRPTQLSWPAPGTGCTGTVRQIRRVDLWDYRTLHHTNKERDQDRK